MIKKYAELDENNIVINTIISSEENARHILGKIVEYDALSNPSRRDAVIGSTYDEINDRFIDPRPYPSWDLDEDYFWQPPVARPTGPNMWDEETESWVALESIEFNLPE